MTAHLKHNNNLDIKRLVNCARCGEEHLNLVAKPFTVPADKYTHWMMCPVLHEPILVEVEDDEEAAKVSG